MNTTFATSNQLATCYYPASNHTMTTDRITDDYLSQLELVNEMAEKITVFSEIMNCMVEA